MSKGKIPAVMVVYEWMRVQIESEIRGEGAVTAVLEERSRELMNDVESI
jgi:hypothetical protein